MTGTPTRRWELVGALTLLTALAAWSPSAPARADDFVLDPGYIEGTVSVPGHSVYNGSVYARGTDPATGQIYTASASIVNGHYDLVVQGGPWEYELRFTIYVDDYGTRVQVYDWATVAVGDTVTADLTLDQWLTGTVSVEGETVTAGQVNVAPSPSPGHGSPAYGFAAYAPVSGGTYSVPVLAAEGVTYGVYAYNVRLGSSEDYLRFPYGYIQVPPAQDVIYDFSLVPAYIEGTVSLEGADITGGSIGAVTYDPSYSYGSTRIASDGTYRLIVFPGTQVRVYGTVTTSVGSISLELRYLAANAGETVANDWTVQVSAGSISGEATVAGVNADRIYIYAYGPNGSSRSSTLYSEGAYALEDLQEGRWGVYYSVYDHDYDLLVGYDRDEYYSPRSYVDVGPGEAVLLDWNLEPGFLVGRVLSEASPSRPALWQHQVHAYESGYPSNGGRAFTYCYDYDTSDASRPQDEFDMFVGPGDWVVRSAWLVFREDIDGVRHTGYLSLRRLALPYVSVLSGETTRQDLDYETGIITARLSVATGEPLSSPRVHANYVSGPGESPEWYTQSASGYSDAADVTQGLVHVHAGPGTYRLVASARVNGSLTTFGSSFEVTVEAGDQVILDPDSPTVVIETPPGNFELSGDSVTVSGTITDESEITSLTINGEAVAIEADGTFSHVVTGLVLGENILTLTAADEHGNEVTIERTVIVVNAPPVATAGGPYAAPEGTAILFDASGSSDPDGNALQYRWDFDGDGAWDTDWDASAAASHVFTDDFAGTALVEISDGSLSDTAEAGVSVANAAPDLVLITASLEPMALGSTYDLTADFEDAGAGDLHSATIDWGDGSSETGAVSESNGSGTVSGSHVYAEPGVHVVVVTVTDDDGGADSLELRYAVVYDPDGGFVTGGGWFDSPAGAYVPDPSVTGRAGFGFVSRYERGQSEPTGNTQFRFKAAGLHFQSDSYEWLVVAGAQAKFRGVGTINGEGDYGFLLTGVDGARPGGGGDDKFRMKIWDRADDDAVVYDNNLTESDEDAPPTTLLGGGNITIHDD